MALFNKQLAKFLKVKQPALMSQQKPVPHTTVDSKSMSFPLSLFATFITGV